MPNPYVIVVAGPNGSGKSSLTDWLRAKAIDFGEYINVDDIARTLSGPEEKRVRAAQTIAEEKRQQCIRAKRSFTFETVMSHPSKIALMKEARSHGFDVHLMFVGTDDPMINLDRVAARVADGGHDVPKDKVLARWYRSMELLQSAIRAADRIFIFDNSTTARFRGAAPHLIFYGGEVDGWTTSLQNADTPAWLQRYVLEPLGFEVDLINDDDDNEVRVTENLIPMGQRCSLSELTDEKCHWPIGEPGKPDFFFCGGRTLGEIPYCGYHARIAYQPPAVRRR